MLMNDFNVLVGPNNSGKSNFLEVFTFVNSLLFGSEEHKKNIYEAASTPRGYSSSCHLDDHKCKPISFSFLLQHTNVNATWEIEYLLSIQCADPFIGIKPEQKDIGILSEHLTIKDISKTGKPVMLFERNKDLLKTRRHDGKRAHNKVDRFRSAVSAINVLFPDNDGLADNFSLAMSALYELFVTRVVFVSPVEIRKNLNHGKGIAYDPSRATSLDILQAIAEIKKDESLYSQFNNVLCQILDIEHASFATLPFPEEFRRNEKEAPEVFHMFQLKMLGQPHSDIRNYSDGTLMVVALLVLLLSPENGCPLICIEEPENCLHPKALNILLSYLKQKASDIQILITTHSPFIINKINPEDVTVARVKDDGTTHFEKINNIRELHRKLRKGYINFGDMLETGFEEDDGIIF
jgi:energy-coupling factor transporter ATP-binding protein EcfA2